MDFSRVLLQDHVRRGAISLMGVDNPDWWFADFTPTIQGDIYQCVWMTHDKETRIEYTHNPFMGVQYCTVSGANQAHHVQTIREALPTYSEGDIQHWIETARTIDESIWAIYHAVILAPATYDSIYFGYLQAALTHTEPEVRKAAIHAAVFVAWPEIRKLLRQRANEDSDAQVAHYAHEALKTYNKFGVPDPEL